VVIWRFIVGPFAMLDNTYILLLLCNMARHDKHLTPTDYLRKGMTPPMKKTTNVAAMLAHAFGE
jgi:hypothetical protein